MRASLLQEADNLAREIDLLVFVLEQTVQAREAETPLEACLRERTEIRRKLDRLRDRMQELADKLAE